MSSQKGQNNPKWNAKKTYLPELQPDRSEWFDVYEIIVSEALLCQHCHNDDTVFESEGHCTKTFSIEDDNALNGKLTEAFQLSVGNGDPDEPESTFTSLFDLMITPDINEGDPNLVSIDYLVYDDSRGNSRWNSSRQSNNCLLYTSPSPRDQRGSRMPSSA